MHVTRRDLVKKAAALAVAAGPIRTQATAYAPGYRHRGYLGWITDLDSRPHPHAEWPSMLLDPTLVDEYKHTFRLMRQLGYNNAVIWGLYVSRYWPVDIEKAVTPNALLWSDRSSTRPTPKA